MDFHRDPQIERELLERLRQKYLTPKPLPHVTELIYCLTRGYFDRKAPIEPTDTELLLFSIGFGLEEVLLRDSSVPGISSVLLDGISLTPDYIALKEMVDLKSGRMRPDANGLPSKGWSETWLEQFMSYAKAFKRLRYAVAIIYIIPPALMAGTFTFTQQELDDNWTHILERKDVYVRHLTLGTAPQPYAYNREWECRYCRYAMRCRQLAKA